MNPNLRLPIFTAVLFVMVGAALATRELRSAFSTPDLSVGATMTAVRSEAPRTTEVAPELSLVRGEAIVTAEEHALPAARVPATEAAAAEVAAAKIAAAGIAADEAAVAEPRKRSRITVTRSRLTVDERIKDEVMERLAKNRTLSGRIGVETRNRVVRLTGRTMTSGQSMRAERQARMVRGVRDVVNEIRPRLGRISS